MALEQFKSGQHKSIRVAATGCNIKYSTLHNRVQGNHLAPSDAHDGEKLLDSSQPSAMVSWCKFKALKGEPLSCKDLKEYVHGLCGKVPSKSWVAWFLNTHVEELKAHKPHLLDPKRAWAFNRSNVEAHFQLLKETLTTTISHPRTSITRMRRVSSLAVGERGSPPNTFSPKGRRISMPFAPTHSSTSLF